MRLAILEDSLTLLENLKIVLDGEAGITVVGAFRSAEDALNKLKRLAPEIVLVDIGLPGMSGIDFIKRAKEKNPRIEMLVYSISEDLKTVSSAFHAGAAGYLIKGPKPRVLVEALMELYEGGAPMTPRIARMVISEFHANIGHCGDRLSQREQEILRCMDRGMMYRDIAKALLISPFTVRTHIRNIYQKLPAKSKTEALRQARKNGLL